VADQNFFITITDSHNSNFTNIVLPSLGSVGIQLDTGKKSGNGVPLPDVYLYIST
jgi:hypothetical protein